MTTALRPPIAQPEPSLSPKGGREAITIRALAPYAVVGILLGVVLVKSEVIYWFRIQEMFRFRSFHMYGVLGSAFLTAFLSLRVVRHLGARARSGEVIVVAPKNLATGRRYWIGGSVFGAGWALSGACPGPLFALMGSGETVYVAAAIAALTGTWTYGYLRPHLPH
jgi:uncharacterized protein